MTVLVHAAQHVALDERATATGDERSGDQSGPEADAAAERKTDVGAQHVEPGVGEIEHAHHAENQRETRGHHEQQEPVNDAVQHRDDQEFHATGSAKWC